MSRRYIVSEDFFGGLADFNGVRNEAEDGSNP